MAENEATFEKEVLLWQSPLVYFGKVVDENGVPISGVDVSYGVSSLNLAREEVRHTGVVKTDTRGLFKVDGMPGVRAMVQLSHPDYYPYPDNDRSYDKRDLPETGRPPDNESTAQLFRMHRKVNPASLIFRRAGLHTPFESLGNLSFHGLTRSETVGEIQMQGWKGVPDNPDSRSFDWKVALTVQTEG